ncbi:MAG TPA: hypothetical protein VNM72_15365 [Blastocatellia bacterium]|nr:hypothetical protein [Blastocatellia bacterium]
MSEPEARGKQPSSDVSGAAMISFPPPSLLAFERVMERRGRLSAG